MSYTYISSFIRAMAQGGSYDLGVMRWTADYNDPDNFTHNLFHSATGQFRTYYSSPEADDILESARREIVPAAREALYRKFENLILQSGVIVPLFHDVGFRLACPQVRGLRLRNTYPAANYAGIGKTETATPVVRTRRDDEGILKIPMKGAAEQLDPARTLAVEEAEVFSPVYETLIQVHEGRITPLLAEEFHVEESGRKYRFRLRENVRFHDGRRLTARDVRYSFERLIGMAENPRRSPYVIIRGAGEMVEGKATDLSGFQIHSVREFTIELTSPVSFFPVLLSDIVVSILPEGTPRLIGGTRGEGAIGTGPFRVVRFESGRRLELERNPFYWREGLPRSNGLVFEFGKSPQEILAGFRAGSFSVVSDLAPADVEALRRDPAFASGYREAPSLSTYFILFNRKRGPLADLAQRRRLVAAVDPAALVRQTLGRRAVPAHGMIPPGLLGHEAYPPVAQDAAVLRPDERPTMVDEFAAAIHPIFTGEYAPFYKALEAAFRAAGVTLRSATNGMPEYLAAWKNGNMDLIIGRWMGDYPDADTFVQFLGSRGQVASYTGSPDLDDLSGRGRVETDPAARHLIYREIEALLRREALMLPLFHQQVYRFARPEIEGMSVSFSVPTVAYERLQLRRAQA